MFLSEFLKNPSMIGAVAPSSRGLARRMIQRIDFGRAAMIVEYGPGQGAFTQILTETMNANTKYFALELNERMHGHVTRRFPRLAIYRDSAARVGEYLRQHAAPGADAVVSGLPWAIFTPQLQDELLAATAAALLPGGHFATFAYIHGLLLPAGKRFRERLARHFSQVETSPIVWWNLPPAFVYWCTK